ncbi:hypothetical protein FCZ14_24030 [Escherichia coli]|nr:hypothetical protein [Escherichia coli]
MHKSVAEHSDLIPDEHEWIFRKQKSLYMRAYSALFDHGLASKSDQRFASIRSTGNLTFSTAF